MRKFLTYTIYFFAIALLVFSCDDGDGNPNRIPICTVDILLDQRMMEQEFVAGRIKTFNHTRGHAGCNNWYGTGGIVVVNVDNDENFLAWDMACPNDHWLGGVVIEWQLLCREWPPHFECQLCGTKFDIFTGTPLPGSATRFVMRQYTVTRINAFEIRVQN